MAIDESSTPFTMPVAPMYGNGGFGDGFGGSWAWIILLLVLCGGWGNGFGGGYGGNGDFPWLMTGQNAINANTNSGFDHAATQSSLGNIQTALTAGFGDVQNALCGGFAGVNATVNGTQSALAQQLYSNEIASLNRSFAEQSANTTGFSNMASQLAQCCCDNRLATCQTQNAIATESAATRASIQSGVQAVLDKLCQDKIDEKNEKIVELQNRLNMADFAASQASQNNYLQNALTAQTQYFLSLYPPTAAAARTTSEASA